MPQRKSYASLKKLCLETLHQNLFTLQHEVKYIPKSLIDDLYDICYKDYDIQYKYSLRSTGKSPPPLPTDLFVHSEMKTINSLNCFDQPADEVVDNINQFCKNLRTICFKENLNHIRAITTNNPHILDIDLSSSMCRNHHLSIIGKNCLQLQRLSLKLCDLISDRGINYLPKKLKVLTLPGQITLKGHLNALEVLPDLQFFNMACDWNGIIKTYAESLSTGCNRTYQIECLVFSLRQSTIHEISHTVGTLFPNLCSVNIWTDVLGSELEILLEAVDCKLLTHLNVRASADFVRIAAHCCPMLRHLHIFVVGKQTLDDRYLAEPRDVPFQHLRELRMWDMKSQFSIDDFKLLLANCKKLEFLTLAGSNQISDQLVYDLLAVNNLKCLERVAFNSCRPITIKSLRVLLQSLDSLVEITICGCSNLRYEDWVTVSQLIAEMNWDLRLNWLDAAFPTLDAGLFDPGHPTPDLVLPIPL